MTKMLAILMLLGLACPACASEWLRDEPGNATPQETPVNEVDLLLYATQVARLDTSLPMNKVGTPANSNPLLPVKVRFSSGMLYITWRWW